MGSCCAKEEQAAPKQRPKNRGAQRGREATRDACPSCPAKIKACCGGGYKPIAKDDDDDGDGNALLAQELAGEAPWQDDVEEGGVVPLVLEEEDAAAAAQVAAAVEAARAARRLWEDPSFAPADMEFGPGVKDKVVWTRVSDRTTERAAVPPAVLPEEIRQGRLGNCPFITSLAAIAAYDARLLQRLLKEGLHGGAEAAGVYAAQFFRAGVWRTVVVDDRVPCVERRSDAPAVRMAPPARRDSFECASEVYSTACGDSETLLDSALNPAGCAGNVYAATPDFSLRGSGAASSSNFGASPDRFTPAFVRTTDSAWWPALLEKAYAKFYRSYADINAGNIAETMCDLTGFPVESVDLKPVKVHTPDTALHAIGKRLVKTWDEGVIMTCGMPVFGAGQHAVGDDGLVSGHAYAVLDVVNLAELEAGTGYSMRRLQKRFAARGVDVGTAAGLEGYVVKLYNPWGAAQRGVWRGLFGAGCDVLPKEVRRHRRLRLDALPAGVFFMPLTSLLLHFEVLNTAAPPYGRGVRGQGRRGYLTPEGTPLPCPPSSAYAGHFSARSSGGGAAFVSHRHNAAFAVAFPEDPPLYSPRSRAERKRREAEAPPDKLYVMLSLPEQRGRAAHGSISYPPIGFTVMRHAGAGGTRPNVFIPADWEPVHQMTYWNKRDVAAGVPIPNDGHLYLVVPSTYYPGAVTSYKALFYHPTAKVEPMQWDGVCQYRQQARWRQIGNHSYRLALHEDCRVNHAEVAVFLCQEPEVGGEATSLPAAGAKPNLDGANAIGVQVRVSRDRKVTSSVVKHQADTEVCKTFTAEAGVEYTVVPETRCYDREAMPFEISIYSPGQLRIEHCQVKRSNSAKKLK
eukprot:TRINITY_DN11747_c0_g2_i1.p1 TRINITY_DN11747_c0_g2~~TRINITY_DN11747_c0_g2_i1.p1  ORF type:complete len:853 (+),score=297.79 TRINITY_DN11747_c0_g2_i1:1823-4381(+)